MEKGVVGRACPSSGNRVTSLKDCQTRGCLSLSQRQDLGPVLLDLKACSFSTPRSDMTCPDTVGGSWLLQLLSQLHTHPPPLNPMPTRAPIWPFSSILGTFIASSARSGRVPGLSGGWELPILQFGGVSDGNFEVSGTVLGTFLYVLLANGTGRLSF